MTWAYDFECDLPILGILAALNRAGPWHWIERDKDAFGTYVSSAPLDGLRVRIYSDPQGTGENGPSYTADFWLNQADEGARSAIEATFNGLLATLSARAVTPGEFWD
jgi:hypothetical protein